MPKSKLSLRESIEQLNEALDTSALLRLIAEHEDWLVCTKLARTDEHSTALLFWNAEAHKTARETLGEIAVPADCLCLPGHRVFSNLAGVIDAISINPGSANAFVIPKEVFGELESIARKLSPNRRRDDRRR